MDVYVHEVPGRLRVKCPSMKGNIYKAKELEDLANGIHGVHSATVNTTTGSIIVQYNPSVLQSRTLLETFAEQGHIDLAKSVPFKQPFEQGIEKTGQILGKALLALAIEAVFEGTPLALLSVVL